MLSTKLNPPKLSKNLLRRSRLIDQLEENSHVPFVLISAPAGYGKSVLVSQWIKDKEGANAWLSLDENMNETSTFLNYLGKLLYKCSSRDREVLNQLDKEYNFLSWESIIEIIINSLNQLEEQTKLILDDYHLIINHEIQQLVKVLISEEIKNLQVIIISRWDPPLQLGELRLYHKVYEIRMSDLRFMEEEITEFLTLNGHFKLTDYEIKMLLKHTEGWIMAIRMILLANTFPTKGKNKKGVNILTKDLDLLMSYICDNLDSNFYRQMQLCALCNQFNEELIGSICGFAFEGSCKAEVFLAKLKELNFFIIATSGDGIWYRFHHLLSETLTRDLKKNEPNIIIPLYLHISSWFSANGQIYEAIQYAIKGEDFKIACNLIIENQDEFLNKGQWWEVQRWLKNIPRHIRNTNVDLLLTELLVCEETWNIEDFFSILEILKSLNIDNLGDEKFSLYLFHLGYFLTFVKPEPKKAVESLEQSIALNQDESYMFGGRRELILACGRQMLGLDALALQCLEQIQEKFDLYSKMNIRSIHGKVLVHLLCGNMELAKKDSNKLQFLVQDSDLQYAKGWASYFQGNVAFQLCDEFESICFFKKVLTFEGVFNYRVYFDALAGLVLISSLKKDEKGTALYLKQMKQLTKKLKDTKFQNYYQSVQARVNWHIGQGDKDLSWALSDWMKQYPSSYLFLIDVPDMTKLRIVLSHGSHTQVEEAISVLEEIEVMLENVHNQNQLIDIFLLKAMGFFRLRKENLAAKWLEEALILAENKKMIRPILEATIVLPSLFSVLEHSTQYRIFNRINFDFATQNLPKKIISKSDALSLREQEVVCLTEKGLSNKEIANKLNISVSTIKSHLTNIFKKLNVSNRTSMLNMLRNPEKGK